MLIFATFFFSFPAFCWISSAFFLPITHLAALEIRDPITVAGVSSRNFTLQNHIYVFLEMSKIIQYLYFHPK